MDALKIDLETATADELRAEVLRLHSLIHTPHTASFMDALTLEAAFQIDHWGTAHDEAKLPEDFFWLIGYLAGKLLRSAIMGDLEKAKHHTISVAAVCLNWHRRLQGDDGTFQPGAGHLAERKDDES